MKEEIIVDYGMTGMLQSLVPCAMCAVPGIAFRVRSFIRLRIAPCVALKGQRRAKATVPQSSRKLQSQEEIWGRRGLPRILGRSFFSRDSVCCLSGN